MYIGGMSNNYTIPIGNINRVTPVNTDNSVDSSAKIKGVTECATCENRMYVDGSNESDVSFKAPGHISPEQSYGKVLSHEQEHVSNAIAEGNKPDKQLISATVSLKMATCPECGRRYVAGGVTKTTMKYTESSPYEKGRKLIEGSFFKGMNIDKAI
ncbi:MAG: hypothetical protein IJO70_01425 [Lachnospiraceae bacterium]|nr:hypothetical protein [Lachnospiraceae bacterium]